MELLNRAQEELGLSRQDLCRMLGLPSGRPQTIRDWEAGRRQMDDARRRLLEAYLAGYRPDDWPVNAPREDVACYLITKHGRFYRPNRQGYTSNWHEAGRYTLDDAVRESHPNGMDGPRDGMGYVHEADCKPRAPWDSGYPTDAAPQEVAS